MQSTYPLHPDANASHYCIAQNQRAKMLNCSNKGNTFQQKTMALHSESGFKYHAKEQYNSRKTYGVVTLHHKQMCIARMKRGFHSHSNKCATQVRSEESQLNQLLNSDTC